MESIPSKVDDARRGEPMPDNAPIVDNGELWLKLDQGRQWVKLDVNNYKAYNKQMDPRFCRQTESRKILHGQRHGRGLRRRSAKDDGPALQGSGRSAISSLNLTGPHGAVPATGLAPVEHDMDQDGAGGDCDGRR